MDRLTFLFFCKDYVRSVEFHPTQPWILSACDDRTAKIWEYKTGRCVLTLIGHQHYVMCARFHPTLPMVATCSLDKTIRVWDIQSLFNICFILFFFLRCFSFILIVNNCKST
jgi:WD40 repeat protein